MPRGKRKVKPSLNDSSLYKALSFLSIVATKTGEPINTHCLISKGWAIQFAKGLQLATPIDDDLEVCPHTLMLLDALSEAPGVFSLTQIDRGMPTEILSVRSDAFGVMVPCKQAALLPIPCAPDSICGVCDDRLRVSLAAVASIASERAETILQGSVQFRGGSVLATNRSVILESFHGNNMPSMTVPKQAVDVILKCGKQLHKFGIDINADGIVNAITFYFTDNSFVRSHLYVDFVPELQAELEVQGLNLWPVTKGLFEGVNKLAKFSVDGTLLCIKDKIMALDAEQRVAIVDAPGVPHNVVLSIADLKLIAPYAKRIHWNAKPNVSVFYDETIRGAIAHKVNL